MFKQRTTGLLLALSLLASLLTGTVVSGAQTAPDLSRSYTWPDYDVSVRYPANWEVVLTGQAVSVRPAGEDVSDGLGPELVLFAAGSAPIDTAARRLAATIGGSTSELTVDWLAGRERRQFSYTRADDAARGAVTLVAASGQVIGAAFVVRAADEAQYLALLAAMLDSVGFGAAVDSLSVSTASVQLPQAYAWHDAGLMLYFPAHWTVDRERDLDGELLMAMPQDAGGPSRIIQGTVLDDGGVPLYAAAMALARDLGTVSVTASTTLAGLPALVFDARDDSEDPPFYVRTVVVDLAGRPSIALLFLTADASDWAAFQPIASAFVASIQPLDGEPQGSLQLVAARPLGAGPLPRQDDPSSPQTVDWEEMGVTLLAPPDWTVLPGDGQEFDLALISPEAYETNTGSFVTLRVIPSLGAGATFETALEPIAENAEVAVEPVTIGEAEAFQVTLTDAEVGTLHHLVLIPYGASGAALYVQTTATPDADAAILDLLQSIAIAPPVPDFAAIDAAWEASLAESGTLVYGEDDAPVKMIEYLSFTCSHCAVYSGDIHRLIALDVETDRVQLQIAPLAGDALAQRATVATYCAAEQGVGYTAYKALFDAYLSDGPQTAYSEEGVRAAVEPLDLDMERFEECLAGEDYTPQLNTVREQFVEAGLTGTPTVMLAADDGALETLNFPDGQVWSGRIQLSALREIIRLIAEEDLSVQAATSQFFAG